MRVATDVRTRSASIGQWLRRLDLIAVKYSIVGWLLGASVLTFVWLLLIYLGTVIAVSIGLVGDATREVVAAAYWLSSVLIPLVTYRYLIRPRSAALPATTGGLGVAVAVQLCWAPLGIMALV
jgi:hypothetical protein